MSAGIPKQRMKGWRPSEVAALLHVTPHTVSEWARRGDLTACRTPGGHLRIPNDEVLRLYRSRRP
jgi:excisionase family DNA binding protein